MDLNYAIFRSQPIMTLKDLAQIGSHNKREKQVYNSNPDIKVELSKNNIELVPLTEKYVKGFYNITSEYKKEYEERMKNVRQDRKKTFNQLINNSNNVVADELLFTATNNFYENMTIQDIEQWANTCMEFVYNDLGYTKEQVLHAVVHLDETTPHIHCVVVPLVKKYDKRTKSEHYTISKKQYIRDKIHLSQLQDKYHQRLIEHGYDLERGIKGSGSVHKNMRELKRNTRNLEKRIHIINTEIDKAVNELDSKMNTNKETVFDKEYIKIKKDTFDSMNRVIKATKKAINIQPKIEVLFNDIEGFTQSHQKLERENKNLYREIDFLKDRNDNLLLENNHLKSYIDKILNSIKCFFRRLLKIGSELIKNKTVIEIKTYYDNNDFNQDDVYDIAVETSKEEELLKYVNYNNNLDYEQDYNNRQYEDRTI